MRILTFDGRARTRLALLAALGAALALAGAAKIGLAATTNGTITATVTVLNDTPAQGGNGLILGQPTPGGNIGYQIHIFNDPALGTSTVNHLVMTASIGHAGTVEYVNVTTGASCSGVGTDTLSCSSAQLASGASFDVTVLFQTDPKGTPGTGVVELNGSGTYAPQSNNDTNKRTPSKSFTLGPLDRNYAGGSGAFLSQSLLLPVNAQTGQGALSVGGVPGQKASVTMPAGLNGTNFLNSLNYVGTTLETFANVTPPSGCPSCQPFRTQTTIPLAATFSTSGPFFDGTTADAYSWSFTIPVPNSFNKPSGVYHTDDLGNNPSILPNCSVVNGVPQAPTSDPGLCISSMALNKKTSPNQATYTGLGVSNGNTWGY